MIAVCYASVLNSQELSFGPIHFNHEFAVTNPGSAAYTGYTKKVNSVFITTLFAEPSVKIARMSFADKSLSRKHGEFTGFNAKGEVLFVSHFDKNRLNGVWTSWFDNRVVCDSGKLVNNIPDGTWKTWYANGQVKAIRSFNAFKYHTVKQEARGHKHSAFSTLAVMAKNDPRAFAQHTDAVTIFNALPAGQQGRLVSPLSLKQIADHNTSGEHGLYLPPFEAGLLHGLYMTYFSNGAMKDSGHYHNGLQHGVWEEWLEGGTVRSVGFYQHGHRKDTWKYYNPSGKLLYIQHYDKHGRPVHGKEFKK